MKGESPITMLTAYDYPSARLVDEAGVDGILVGDSLAMAVQGHDNTLPVTLDQMIYHTEMVVRATRKALVVLDLPFPTFQLGPIRAVEAAARALKETGCPAVKLEGGRKRRATLEAIAEAGIPVMGHIGLSPQEVHQMGGYRVERNREKLLDDARAIEEAGAFSVVLEYVPTEIAKEITEELTIPTIGIGAGPDCDGQILVFHDVFGIPDHKPLRHVRQYAEMGREIKKSCDRYCRDVRQGRFPGEEHSIR